MTEAPLPIDQLLALPPTEFVSARNKLAAALKKTDRARAAAVKALPKPSPSVWAINQIARRSPERIARYLEASDALERAQSGRGGADEGRKGYQAALATQREALDRMVTAARAALTEAKLPANRAVLERVTNDLRWAVLDPASRRLLEEGRLSRDLEPPDFSALVERMPIVARVPKGSAVREEKRPPPPPKPEEPAASTRMQAEQKRRVDALTARHAGAQAQTAIAREELEEAKAAQTDADKAVAALRKELAAAEKKAALAARTREEAAEALEQRTAQLERLAEELAAASGT